MDVAGAGTGKTALLVSPVVVWCVSPGWDRHAADRRIGDGGRGTGYREGRSHYVHRGRGRRDGAQDRHRADSIRRRREPRSGWDPEPGLLPTDEDEVWARARALSEERLVVSTIHAFCQRLLSTYRWRPGFAALRGRSRRATFSSRHSRRSWSSGQRALAEDPDRARAGIALAVVEFSTPEVVSALCDLERSRPAQTGDLRRKPRLAMPQLRATARKRTNCPRRLPRPPQGIAWRPLRSEVTHDDQGCRRRS